MRILEQVLHTLQQESLWKSENSKAFAKGKIKLVNYSKCKLKQKKFC